MTLAAALASVVAAFGALAAVWYARQTVHEARLARREDERDRRVRRLLRVGELASEIATLADSGGHNRASTPIKLLGVTLAALGPTPALPTARQVAATEISFDVAPLVAQQARDALDEVRAVLEAETGGHD